MMPLGGNSTLSTRAVTLVAWCLWCLLAVSLAACAAEDAGSPDGAPTGIGGSVSAGGASSGGATPAGSTGVVSSGGATPSGGADSGGATSTAGTSSGGSGRTSSVGTTSPTVGVGGQATGGQGGVSGEPGSTGLPGGTGGVSGSPAGGPFCEIPDTLREAGDCTGRLVGAALAANHLSEPAYAAAAREHSYVTCENEMKWDALQPSRDQFNFGPADQVVSFASDNGMLVKGHTLVWHSQLPQWVQSLSSADDARTVMLDHIETVVSHYQGQVVAWDVVNEVWQNEEDWIGGQPTLRDYVFTQLLGDSFIDEAFIAAHAADPNAKLYYNDYRADGLNAKSDAIYEMVSGMVERGVPIHGVGLQTHLGARNGVVPVSEITANMQRIANLGLEVLISEMDIDRCAGQTPEQQRQDYYDIISVCVAQPACPAITFWGITDRYSWLIDKENNGCTSGQDPAALLWDSDYNKKPAYYGVMDALTGH